MEDILPFLLSIIIILFKLENINWHNKKNADDLFNWSASNFVIFNKAHRVAWLIGLIGQ